MNQFFSNIKSALRGLIRRPRFSLSVILILTLAIGINTAMFSVIHTVLLKPLEPFDHPKRIVLIEEGFPNRGADDLSTSHSTLSFWREHSHSFEAMAGRIGSYLQVEINNQGFHQIGSLVSPGYFSVMGVKPALGRKFLPEEEKAGHEQVVILSNTFWQQHFDAHPDVLGQTLRINHADYIVIGVMPPDFHEFCDHSVASQLWIPLVLDTASWNGLVDVYARLKPAVSLPRAQTEMNAIETQFSVRYPRKRAGYTARVSRMLDIRFSQSRSLLYPVWITVGLVLLIASLNTSGLFLIRGEMRKQEIAIRLALGAARRQNIFHVLTESFLLSIIAGGLGLMLSCGLIRIFALNAPIEIPHLYETRMNATVLAFMLSLSLLTGLFSALVPAWKATGFQPNEIIKQGSSSQIRQNQRFKNLLVITQIGMALTLILSVALMTQSLRNVCKTNLGFRPENIIVADINLPRANYPDHFDQEIAFCRQLAERMQTLPGVEQATFTVGALSMGFGGGTQPITIANAPPPANGHMPMIRECQVSADFFNTMDIPLLKGRGFTEQDVRQNRRVMVIDENLARTYFSDGNPLGREITVQREIGKYTGTIIGVIKPLKDFSTLAPSACTAYILPYMVSFSSFADLIVRTTVHPTDLFDAIEQQVSEIDPTKKIYATYVLENRLSGMLDSKRYIARLLSLFAGVALLLATVGIFGLLQYTVSQSTHEIGIRMALGATRKSISRMFLKRAILLLLPGVGLGLIGGYAAQKILGSFLYNASIADPKLIAAACSVLFLAGLTASWLPAHRAAETDPMEALRYE